MKRLAEGIGNARTRLQLAGCRCLAAASFLVPADLPAASETNSAYLFTSFREPAQDGLRFLFSFDGYHWTNVPGIFLKPNVGSGKLMRDPSLLRGPDGTFHLVWTTGWRGDQGFGYAHSQDLVHWSEQKFVPVMAHEPTTVNVWAPELFYDEGRKAVHHLSGPPPFLAATRTISSPTTTTSAPITPPRAISRPSLPPGCSSSPATASLTASY